ncbi:MAG TPA: hypothetical protein VNN80_21155 [Polyangiaceae bacterium]|nr:hypothetical protein [Polyangiaceae bacterium]
MSNQTAARAAAAAFTLALGSAWPARVHAETVCGSVAASWNVPAGAAVFTRGAGPIRDVIDAIGESRSHSMLSHGPGNGVSHATMLPPAINEYSTPITGVCARPLNAAKLRDGYPGASMMDAGGLYTYLYGDASPPEFVYFQLGDADGENLGATVQDYLLSDAPGIEVASRGDAAETLWRYHNAANTDTINYSLYQFRDLEHVNYGDDAWNNGLVCSTFLSWAQARSGVNIEQPITYPNEVIRRAAYRLHDTVFNECQDSMGFWGSIKAAVGCLFVDVCDLAANQVVNCMAEGECGDTTDRWKRVVDAPGTVATSISPDCVGGWNSCSKQGEGASIWAYDDSRVVQWNADGNQYGCWE